MTQKIKVKHGDFVDDPVCEICQTPISHDWLAGDYTMLVCEKEQCFQTYMERRKLMRETTKDTVDDLAKSVEKCIELLTQPSNK